ncbi:uncharacterized protein PV09_05873 [Verruconis gallopava]|uniref:Uncharacterized protein n=1 Tax=Verruconis gallopava TaxID=253628 RepID=A0A0D2A893_9PEZI|nr:uncharacterized protein PV09_05873 [Verruconis gallopava]KIW02815.1 hypothetical protein PV09_05873 [Verruconis gallopava]
MANVITYQQLKHLDNQESEHIATFTALTRRYKDIIQDQEELIELLRNRTSKLEAVIKEYSTFDDSAAASLAQDAPRLRAKLAELGAALVERDSKIEELKLLVEKARLDRHAGCTEEISKLKEEAASIRLASGDDSVWRSRWQRSEEALKKDKAALEQQLLSLRRKVVTLQERIEELKSDQVVEDLKELKRLAKDAVADLDRATMVSWGEMGQKLLRLADFAESL